MSSLLTEVLSPNYKSSNLVAYNFAGFACISVAVFLLASQPFYLSEVMKLDPSIMGATIGTLGVVDETTAIVAAPMIGTLIDFISMKAWQYPKLPSGPRFVAFLSFCFLSYSLCYYGTWAHNVHPDLWLARSLFAMGVTGVMSTVVVMLHEAGSSDFLWSHLLFWSKTTRQLPQNSANPEETHELTGLISDHLNKKSKNGKLSALLGVCTGLGAIFSVFFFLTLPNRVQSYRPNSLLEINIKFSYILIGYFSFMVSLILLRFGYDSVRQRRAAGVVTASNQQSKVSFLAIMHEGFMESTKSRRIQVAYCGSLVSRATSVATSVFISFLVFSFFNATGRCGSTSGPRSTSEPPSKDSCREGFVFLAILTGVAQTVALLSTPIWGVLLDCKRFGNIFTLMIAAIVGVVGSLGLCSLGYSLSVYDPRNAWCFLTTSLISSSQTGLIISSMSILSTFGTGKAQEESNLIGSVTGFYHLSGGVGVLLLSKLGGSWSDKWTLGPFFILGCLNAFLTLVCACALKNS